MPRKSICGPLDSPIPMRRPRPLKRTFRLRKALDTIYDLNFEWRECMVREAQDPLPCHEWGGVFDVSLKKGHICVDRFLPKKWGLRK